MCDRGQNPCQEPLRGQCLRLWEWGPKLYNGNPRKLEMAGMWNVLQKKTTSIKYPVKPALERGPVGCSQQGHGGGGALWALWSVPVITMCLGCCTYGYGIGRLYYWVWVLLWYNSFLFPIPPFGNGEVYSVPFYHGPMQLVLWFFAVFKAKSCLDSQKWHRTWTLYNVGIVEILGTKGDGLKIRFALWNGNESLRTGVGMLCVIYEAFPQRLMHWGLDAAIFRGETQTGNRIMSMLTSSSGLILRWVHSEWAIMTSAYLEEVGHQG